MSTNEALVKKADIAIGDLASGGGLLNPDQTDTFIRTLIDSPTILNTARVVTMNAPQKQINKIGFGTRILRPAVSATQLSSGDRVKPDLGQVTLISKEVIAELHIPYDVLEDNIEGGNINAGATQSAGGIEDTILALIAQRTALDLEELAILGDTGHASDTYLQLTDGFLIKADINIVDALGAPMSKGVFKSAVLAMPDKYLRVRGDNSFYISTDQETEYRDTVSNRVTGLGDAALVSANNMSIHGSPIQAAALMPNASGIYTNPNNLIFGIQRRVNLEFDKDIRARTFIIVVTARIDFQVEEADAAVVITNIG